MHRNSTTDGLLLERPVKFYICSQPASQPAVPYISGRLVSYLPSPHALSQIKGYKSIKLVFPRSNFISSSFYIQKQRIRKKNRLFEIELKVLEKTSFNVSGFHVTSLLTRCVSVGRNCLSFMASRMTTHHNIVPPLDPSVSPYLRSLISASLLRRPPRLSQGQST